EPPLRRGSVHYLDIFRLCRAEARSSLLICSDVGRRARLDRDHFSSVILGFAAIGAMAFVFLAYSSGAWKVQIVNWVTAGITYLTGLLVWYYLVETRRLRIATERQAYPFIVLRFDLEEVDLPSGGGAIEWPTVFAVNLGGGPAVDIHIDGLEIRGID